LKKRVNVAVIGLGDTGIIHTNAYMNNPKTDVIAVCDTNEERIISTVEGPWRWADWMPRLQNYQYYTRPKKGIKKVFSDCRDLAADEEVEAVSICLPTVFHGPVASTMLQAGKHVLIEKPMAGSVEECQEMIQAAQSSGVKLQVGHMWRFHSEVKFLRGVVKSGLIGKIVKIKGYAILIRSGLTGWFLQKKFAVGGTLLDMGIHAIDTIRYVLDNPVTRKVYANTTTAYGDYEVDDSGIIMVEFFNGPVAIIETGQNHPYADGPEACVQVFGTKGYARIFPAEIQYKIGGGWGSYRPEVDVPHLNPFMFQEEVDSFIESILTNKEPLVNGREGMESVRIAVAALKSSQTGKMVDIGY
jgi:predicted dehydrogenase